MDGILPPRFSHMNLCKYCWAPLPEPPILQVTVGPKHFPFHKLLVRPMLLRLCIENHHCQGTRRAPARQGSLSSHLGVPTQEPVHEPVLPTGCPQRKRGLCTASPACSSAVARIFSPMSSLRLGKNCSRYSSGCHACQLAPCEGVLRE